MRSSNGPRFEDEDPMQPTRDGATKDILPCDAQKEWCSPVLRTLPIAATAHSSKPGGNSNDGGGGGKGEVAGRHHS
jgi:hypothetical protein